MLLNIIDNSTYYMYLALLSKVSEFLISSSSKSILFVISVPAMWKYCRLNVGKYILKPVKIQILPSCVYLSLSSSILGYDNKILLIDT